MVGAAFASYPPINMTFLCSIAQPQNVSKTLATNNACSCVARFASPVIINWITGLFGGGVRAAFVTSCIGLVVVFILLFFFNPVKNTDLEEKAG